MKKRKLAFIFGTRPEIIKLSPVIKQCIKRDTPFFCVHTGQHYSYEMDGIFFKELGLPAPKHEHRLHIRSKAPYRQGDHTGRMLIKLEDILLKEMPYCVIVQGDTNSAFAGALTAEKISTTKSYTGFHIKVAHVEAGLRSYDRSMPEETNRFIADHLSDFLFVPTIKEKKILLKEGVSSSWIYITGNTIVDAVKKHAPIAERNSVALSRSDRKRIKNGKLCNWEKGKYILATLHRQENVDSKKIFKGILKGMELTSKKLKLDILFLAHPRTWKMRKKFNLELPQCIHPRIPAGFLDFLKFEQNAALILTDSGGVQEEACTLRVPCVTLRNNTERPETVEAGANIVAGVKPDSILKAAIKMSGVKRDWKNPLGNGKAAEQIIKVLMR